MDNIVATKISPLYDIQNALATRFRARRLAMNLSQEGLAARAGVGLGTLKRFEHRGLIAIDALLKLSLVLGCLADFDRICEDDPEYLSSNSLDEILAEPKLRNRGRIK